MGRGILLRTNGEEGWDKEKTDYTLTYIKNINPINLLYIYDGDVKDPYELSK